MSSLARFGRRQAKRLHSLTSRLSSRQKLGMLVVGVICALVAIASVAGQVAIAMSLLAVLLAVNLAGVVHLSWRVGGLHRTGQASVRDLRIVVEQLQRRVLAAVEKERLSSGDRHQELTDTIAGADRLTPAGAELLLREQNREIEALAQLFQHLTPRAPMPVAGAPTDLLGLLHIVRRRKPKLSIVLGAGPSVVWLGYALEKTGRLVVVEHDAEQVTQVRTLLKAHGLGAVEVRHAPLTELSLEGRTADWYDVDTLDGLHDVDLLVVDGPAATADALPLALYALGRRLATGAAVVVEETPRTAPRQGGFEGLTAERRLIGKYTALSYTPAMTTA
jgi:predicted O-methyltransferase YrrM